MAQVFNKAALERLQSPEQINKALKLTSPISWLVLLGATLIVAVTAVWAFLGTIPVTVTANSIITAPSGVIGVYAPEAGRRIDIAETGAKVGAGAVNNYVLTYFDSAEERKALKIVSDSNGTVQSQVFTVTDSNKSGQFNNGQELLRITPTVNGQSVLVCYVQSTDKNKIEIGDKVKVYPSGSDKQKDGYMSATVIHIDAQTTTDNGFKTAGIDGTNASSKYTTYNNAQTSVYAVVCELEIDPSTASGYSWSNRHGKTIYKVEGFAESKIVTDEVKPIEKFISGIAEKLGLEE